MDFSLWQNFNKLDTHAGPPGSQAAAAETSHMQSLAAQAPSAAELAARMSSIALQQQSVSLPPPGRQMSSIRQSCLKISRLSPVRALVTSLCPTQLALQTAGLNLRLHNITTPPTVTAFNPRECLTLVDCDTKELQIGEMLLACPLNLYDTKQGGDCIGVTITGYCCTHR